MPRTNSLVSSLGRTIALPCLPLIAATWVAACTAAPAATPSPTTDAAPQPTTDPDAGAEASSPHAPGSLDDTFGTNGVVTFNPSPEEDEGKSMVQQADGKIVMFGHVTNATGIDYALVRFDTNGTVDKTFGQEGIATLDVDPFDFSASVAQQADGKLVIVGYGRTPVVARFNGDGTLDRTFGAMGVVKLSLGSSSDRLRRVLITPAGDILATALLTTGSTFETGVVALQSDGQLDTSFGTDGVARVFPSSKRNFANTLTRQSDGKLVLAGYSGSDVVVTRLEVLGQVDTSFGQGGLVTTTVGDRASVGAMVAQTDGKLVVAGSAGTPTSSMTLVRYSADGALDMTFGEQGITRVSAPNEDAQANAVALQPDGKILAGGFSGLADAAHFMLVRLTPAGSLDTAFGNAGKVAPAFPAPAFGEYGVSLLVQADGRVVLGGYRDLNPSGASTLDFAFAMARVWQ